jgi:hypothetical protein
MAKQRNEYDIFMYIEDDILVPKKAIEYWLTYHERLVEQTYNLGFLRVEVDKGVEYIVDLDKGGFDTTLQIDNAPYCVNNKNPYCAFWIYDKKEFARFIDSKYYNIENIKGYNIRESSAIGLHGKTRYWYKDTLIPIIDNKLVADCKIYHMPNNYVTNKHTRFGKTKFNDALIR